MDISRNDKNLAYQKHSNLTIDGYSYYVNNVNAFSMLYILTDCDVMLEAQM